MLEPKEAAVKARQYFSELTVDVKKHHVALAELERSTDGSQWSVTFTYSEDELFMANRFRVVTIDAATGAFISMKIKNPQ